MVYMKRLEGLGIRSTNVTDFSFITELPNLKCLILHSPGNEHFTETLPSLKNSADLNYLILYANLENLDIIAENPELENIIISAYSTAIKDISGLRNKLKLEYADLANIECSDMSLVNCIKRTPQRSGYPAALRRFYFK